MLASWRRAWGRVKFDGRMDLAKIAPLLPAGALPVNDVRGTMTVEESSNGTRWTYMTPGVRLSLKTAGLSLVGASKRITDVDGATTSCLLRGTRRGSTSRSTRGSWRQRVRRPRRDARRRARGAGRPRSQVGHGAVRKSAREPNAVSANPRSRAVQRPRQRAKALTGHAPPDDRHRRRPGRPRGRGHRRRVDVDADHRRRCEADSGARSLGGLELPADLEATAHYDGSHVDAKLKGSVGTTR